MRLIPRDCFRPYVYPVSTYIIENAASGSNGFFFFFLFFYLFFFSVYSDCHSEFYIVYNVFLMANGYQADYTVTLFVAADAFILRKRHCFWQAILYYIEYEKIKRDTPSFTKIVFQNKTFFVSGIDIILFIKMLNQLIY